MYKLLIADDEPRLRNGISNYFPWNETGFEVLYEASNGKQALEFIEKNHVDVVLSDIRMPIMSGIDLAREIYNRGMIIKVIFLTGYKDFEYAKEAINYGVKNYVLKPTKYNELAEVFSKIKKELDKELENKVFEDVGTIDSEFNGIHEKIIAEVKDYVTENYHDARLEKAAGRVHLSEFYLSKLFKRKTGENFSDFVISVKMNKAAQLLKEINYKTYEVGNMVGYDSSKTFSRAFKNYFGISPKEYRKDRNSDDRE
ncbi:two component transcriptional regulator, AraC family [Ruminiclostridium papyrosolvens DSM 2782]|uniref:Stage 0 sporulation protein A homolog n=1 Tax=Ruminiclostridium papyrosolvens DSM 2782 TaxID=588581 RepID=F1TF81_9FIRM|nr:response regulator [Ruminiclostridium papyrosolvens]EGD47019.1 two component transcriptional regulator, AraC family [Ruminiclostridium papyrosolvens DSM 2782]WES33732.1 response regulator [Ruminiclostridium papyrosolvens DSM 2782]